MLVRDFQKVIGEEAREQILIAAGRLPDLLIACVGGGSNAMGLFYPFGRPGEMIRGGGRREGTSSGKHAATLCSGSIGVSHGSGPYLLQDADGQITEALHFSGPRLPGVGLETLLKDLGRARYVAVDDNAALEAFHALCSLEGIIPALESAHALAYAMVEARKSPADRVIVVNLSGRESKDLGIVSAMEEKSRS
ncbi:MAG: pyridoxal-phosphate dependent enzyme [Balneolaceae bacterium]|nr:pyridoxal-phosphate dependent enzyme [Balneolaceae bacterium]